MHRTTDGSGRVNDFPAGMAPFLDMGVDGIITDRPDLMIELLQP